MSGTFPITTRLLSEENHAFWLSLSNKQEVIDYIIALLRERMATKEGAANIWAAIRAQTLTLARLQGESDAPESVA